MSGIDVNNGVARLQAYPVGRSVGHSFATHLLEDGYDIRTVQALVGHKDVRPTMIDTHVLNRRPSGVVSPLDRACGAGISWSGYHAVILSKEDGK